MSRTCTCCPFSTSQINDNVTCDTKKPRPYGISPGLHLWSLILVLQDAEKEKQSIMKQFADVTRRRTEVDDAQKPLLVELNAVKQQINDFNQTQTGIVVNSISCDCLRTLHHPEQG